ncbi:MAG: tetratricopeptide repeat protein [Acutalibacteraceae bacterium]
MKKIGNYFRQAYISTSAKWLFGVLAALSILPDLIKTIMLILIKESLSTDAVFLADLLCVVCASAFAFLAIRSVNGQTKQAAVIWLKGYIPCLAALYAGEILEEYLGGQLGVTGKIIGCAAGGILLGLAFHLLGSAMRGKTKRKACREIIRIGATVLLAFACWYLLPYFFGLGVQAVFSGNKVWSAKLVAGLLNTIFRWALLMPVLKFVCGENAQTEADEEALQTKNKKSFLPYIPTCISVAVLLISAVMLFPKTASPADRLKDEYYTRTNMACYNLLGGNIITAVNDYSDIQRELEIWKSVADGGWNTITEQEVASNPVLAYLDAYVNHTDDRLETMEKYYTAGYIKDTDFCFEMLTEYKKADTLTAEQKNRRTEILTNLAANGLYVGGLPDVQENAAAMTEVIETASSYQNSFDYATLLAKMRVGIRNGSSIADSVGTGITYSIVDDAIEKALKNPEDFVWNYIAVMLYNNQERHTLYLTSEYSADYQILTVVENFEKQFEKQLGNDISGEELLGVKKLVMQTYLRALALDKCADYGLEALKSLDNSYIRENTMYALLKTGRYDECLKLAKETETGTNPAPIYYAAAATLENGDFDVSVDYALELAEQVKTSEYPKKADELLHSYLALLIVDTETTEAKYGQLSEAQISKLQSDEFLKYYLEAYANAYYSTYDDHSIYSDSYKEALDKAIAAADQVLSVRDDLCYPYYLKGVALAQQEKFEDAVGAYKKAIEYKSDDPMIWYALYSAYAELEDWENAYTAAEIAIGQSPWFNYYSDYEGIGIHMYSYRDHAKEQIEKQHEASQKGGNE